MKIEEIYQKFIKEMKIDENTGKLNKDIKFATYPFIGSNYYNSTNKILFIGLDIGQDETPNRIQSLEERREKIENKYKLYKTPQNINKKNKINKDPHIPGTYITTIYFLDSIEKEPVFQGYWEKIKDEPSYIKAVEIISRDDSKVNPLSYIALTNYHKFVHKKRKTRKGGLDRKTISTKEQDLLIDEIKCLKPNIIIFQSTGFTNKKQLLERIRKFDNKIYFGPHPSYYFKDKKRNPKDLIQIICLHNNLKTS